MRLTYLYFAFYVLSFSTFICIIFLNYHCYYYEVSQILSGMSSDIKKNINIWVMGVKRTDKLLPLSSFSFFSHQIPWLSFKLYLSFTCVHFRKKLIKAYTKVWTLIFLTHTFALYHRDCPLPFTRFSDRIFLLVS